MIRRTENINLYHKSLNRSTDRFSTEKIKYTLFDQILASQKRQIGKSKASSENNSTASSTIGYILFLLSSILLVSNWFGSWVDTDSDQATSTSKAPIFDKTTQMSPTTPTYRFSKYGCAFGLQGRYCERNKNLIISNNSSS